MIRLPLAIGTMRLACQRSAIHVANQSIPLKYGYAAPVALRSSALCSNIRAYSQTATISSTSPVPSPTDTVKIYEGVLAGKFWRLKILSMSTSVVCLCAQPVLIEKGAQMAGTAGVVALCSVGGFFTFITPILLHFVVKKYVIAMEHNPVTDEYTATTISLFLRRKKVSIDKIRSFVLIVSYHYMFCILFIDHIQSERCFHTRNYGHVHIIQGWQSRSSAVCRCTQFHRFASLCTAHGP